MLTPAQRTMRARIAAHAKWANTPDRTAATAKWRNASLAKFDQMARATDPDATEAQLAAMAKSFQLAHLERMRLRSSQIRKAKRAAKSG